MKLTDLKKDGAVTVMYHYVRDNIAEGTPNLKSLDIKKFRSQLDWLCKHFSPLSFEDYQEHIATEKPFPNDAFLLTFDDGLKDHYSYVFPELKKRGLFGFFFINSKVYTEQQPLEVHMTHFVLDKIGSKRFTEQVVAKLKDYNIEVPEFNKEGVYRYDNSQYAIIKKMMNYSIEFDIRDQILDEVFYQYFNSKEDFIRDVYATESELQEMIDGGMVIGSHTHAHRVLSRLSPEQQLEDLRKSAAHLKQVFNINNSVFCYPYGHTHTYDDHTLAILEEYNFHSAFNTKRGTTRLATGKYELGRFDTADIVHLHP